MPAAWLRFGASPYQVFEDEDEYEAGGLPTGNLCYVVLLRYGFRISRKHWIKSLSDLPRVHELWHFEMEGLGYQ